MKPKEIQRIRQKLGETTAEFGARFEKSSRTVEGWEQGRRKPDRLVVKMILAIEVPK